MENYFKNKVVWITGASSGIGEELALQVNNAGGIVILSARNENRLTEVKNKLKFSDNGFVLPLDLEQTETFDQKVQQLLKKYDKIDVLFNNGGLSQRGEASATSLDVDRRIMEINYFGNIALTKAILPVFQRQKSGHIVVVSSIAGKFGFYLRSAYAASKHALQGFYESVLLEEAKNNIYVTIAYPGKINTDISKSALTADGKSHGVMDHNQETGMPVQQCVTKLLKATAKKKKSILIGNREIWAVYIKRFSPRLFWKIIRKQSPT